MAHPDNTPHHRTPVAPSAINPEVDVHTVNGIRPSVTPRELGALELRSITAEFRHAAASAIAAGADGVEVHAANGYLLHQFLSPNSNLRSDEYGGSIENRSRFVVEVARAVANEIGSDRTGIRISPSIGLGGLDEGDPIDVYNQYRHLVTELASLNLAYLHLFHNGGDDLVRMIRDTWPSALMVLRLGRTRDQIGDYIDAGLADIAPVGRFALSNPDLVKRLRHHLPLNDADPSTFYGGGEKGYVDYPAMALD
jgi:2,4-dienoyl-CoA reductase-like NADH-dependent reductase (Old Yellow Enzyme family)